MKWRVLLLGGPKNVDGPTATSWMMTFTKNSGICDYCSTKKEEAEKAAREYNGNPDFAGWWVAYAVPVDEHGNIIPHEGDPTDEGVSSTSKE